MYVIDEGKDVCFHCGMIEGYTTLTACENMCPRYYYCDTVAMANDVLVEVEQGSDKEE